MPDLELALDLIAALEAAGHAVVRVSGLDEALGSADAGRCDLFVAEVDGEPSEQRLLERWARERSAPVALISTSPRARRLARLQGASFFERPVSPSRRNAQRSPVRGDTLPDALWAAALAEDISMAAQRTPQNRRHDSDDNEPSAAAVRDVLIVDDDASIRDVLREVLEDEGYSVAVAENGLEALRLVRGEVQPRMILLDLMMPVMDGWQLRRELERDPELRAIPVAVVSAFVPFDRQTALRAQAVLKKPVDLAHLLGTVESLLG